MRTAARIVVSVSIVCFAWSAPASLVTDRRSLFCASLITATDPQRPRSGESVRFDGDDVHRFFTDLEIIHGDYVRRVSELDMPRRLFGHLVDGLLTLGTGYLAYAIRAIELHDGSFAELMKEWSEVRDGRSDGFGFRRDFFVTRDFAEGLDQKITPRDLELEHRRRLNARWASTEDVRVTMRLFVAREPLNLRVRLRLEDTKR